MANIYFKNLSKVYSKGTKNEFEAVKGIDLKIDDEDFVVLLGPSGCGKTTTLRMLAGLEEVSNGEIYIDDVLVNYVEPKDRNIAMVFQNYALYPHMSVYDNIAFGLKNRKVDKKIIDEKVRNAAKVLDIEIELERKPKELSGGQRQRVAMGRAMVRNPKVFLMDEPLSNLDAKLRVQMRNELIKLHRDLRATFVFVTHDQIEAMTLATKIVVMNKGHIMQVGSPKDIFNNPKNLFVAGFIGSPQMNFIEGKLNLENGKSFFVSDDIKIEIVSDNIKTNNQELVLGIRPEHILQVEKETEDSIEVTVNFTENMGSYKNVYARLGATDIIMQSNSEEILSNNEKIYVEFDKNKIHLFDKQTTLNIKEM
jgi:multiple sugar transport system ATP-binding protein